MSKTRYFCTFCPLLAHFKPRWSHISAYRISLGKLLMDSFRDLVCTDRLTNTKHWVRVRAQRLSKKTFWSKDTVHTTFKRLADKQTYFTSIDSVYWFVVYGNMIFHDKSIVSVNQSYRWTWWSQIVTLASFTFYNNKHQNPIDLSESYVTEHPCWYLYLLSNSQCSVMASNPCFWSCQMEKTWP